MTCPIVLTSATTVNAMGRGLKETTRALRSERSGLRPNDFEDAGERLDTFIGPRAGASRRPPSPGHWPPSIAATTDWPRWPLETDGFAGAVAQAAARYGSDRIAVIMGSSTSGIGQCEDRLSPKRRGRWRGNAANCRGSFNFDETHDFYSLPRFAAARLNLEGPSTTVSARLRLEQQGLRRCLAMDRGRHLRCGGGGRRR